MPQNINAPKVKTIGKNFAKKVPIVNPDAQISEIKHLLYENATSYETINYIYIVSEKGRLKGVASIKEILSTDPEVKVKDIMQSKVKVAYPHTDEEKAARMAVKYGLKAIPVVDDGGYLLGVFSSDEVQGILNKEAEEDLLRIAGYIMRDGDHESIYGASIFRSYWQRIPWIALGLLGGLITAKVISTFEPVIAQNLILASFIPLVAYLANAVGAQTQILYIRELARSKNIKIGLYGLRQISVSFLIGATCFAMLVVFSSILWGGSSIGIIIGTAVFLAVLVASFLALIIPHTLLSLNLDPAIGSGPFSTSVQDLISVLIYFSTASYFMS